MAEVPAEKMLNPTNKPSQLESLLERILEASKNGISAEDAKKLAEEFVKALGKKKGKSSLLNNAALNTALEAASKRMAKSAKTFEKAVADAAKHGRALPGGGGGGSSGGGGGGDMDGSDVADDFSENFGRSLRMTLSSVLTGLLAGSSVFQILFNDSIKQEMKFSNGMDLILYQTQGVTKEAGSLQKAFKETQDIVDTTGYGLTTFQNTLIETSRRALKDAKSITKTSLNLGHALGFSEGEAAGIAEQFADMNQNLGLSEIAIADVARGIKDVARFSGLTGKNLMEVVKQSEAFMDRMRAAGNLTSVTAKNVMNLSAEAKKLGILGTSGFTEITKNLSNGADLFLGGASESKNLIFAAAQRVDQMGKAWDGTMLNTKKGMKDFAKGINETVKDFSGGFGIDQLDKLDPGQRSQLNIQLQSMFGLGADDMKRLSETFAKTGQTFEERMAGIEKQINRNATAEERLTAERQKQELLMSKSFEFSSQLADAAKNASSFDDALTKMKTQMGADSWKEAQLDLAQVAGTFSKELQDKVMSGDSKSITQAMGLSSAKALKQSGGQDFSAEISKAIANNDMAGFREIQKKMDVEAQKNSVDVVNALDPMKEMAQYLKEINESIRGFTGPAMVSLTSMAGGMGLLVGKLGLAIASSISGVEAIKSGLDAVKSVGTGADVTKGAVGTAGGADATKGAAEAKKPVVGGIMDEMMSTPKVEEPEFNADKINEFAEKLHEAGPALTKAAAQMAKTIVGLVGLAVGITVLAKGIMKVSGVSPEEMLKTGVVVAGIIAGVGGLAAALEEALPYLETLGDLEIDEKVMYKGALLLLKATAGLTLLASAIAIMGAAVIGALNLMGIDPAKVAADIASLIWSVGIIAGAVILGMGGLFLLGLAAPLIAEALPIILAGGAALMLIAPGMVLLAAAIAGLGALAMNVIDPASAAQTAEGIAALFGAVGDIAWACLKSMAGLFVLGLATPLILLALPIMSLGGNALLLMVPGMILLGAAIAGLGALAMKLGDPAKASQTAESMATLFGAIGSMAWACLKGMAGLFVLGLATPLILLALPIMNLGGNALLLMIPGMTLLGIAITTVANSLMKNGDPAAAAQTAEGIATMFGAIADIAWACLKSMAGLSLLALSLPFIWLAIPLMNMGATALMMMIPPMVLIGSAIIAMAGAFSTESSKATETAQNLAATLDAVGDIAWAIIKTSGQLAALGMLAFIAPWVAAMAWAGVAAIGMLIMPVVAISHVIKLALAGMANINEKKLKAFTRVPEVITAVLTSLRALEPLGELTRKKFKWKGLLGVSFTSDLEDLVESTESFGAGFGKVIVFVKKIMKHVGNIGDADRIEGKIKAVENAASVLTAIPKIVNAMKSLGEMSKEGTLFWVPISSSEIDSAIDSCKGFTKSMPKIQEFAKDVMSKIDDSGGGSYDMEEKVKIITGICAVFEAIPKIIKALDSIGNLAYVGGWTDSKLTDAIDNIGPFFEESGGWSKIVNFATKVTQQISDMPYFDGSDLSQRIDSIKSSFEALPEIINVLGVLGKLSEGGIFGGASKMASSLEGLGEVARLFNEAALHIVKIGMFTNMLNNSFGNIETDKLSNISDVIEELPNIMESLGEISGLGMPKFVSALPAVNEINSAALKVEAYTNFLLKISAMLSVMEQLSDKNAEVLENGSIQLPSIFRESGGADISGGKGGPTINPMMPNSDIEKGLEQKKAGNQTGMADANLLGVETSQLEELKIIKDTLIALVSLLTPQAGQTAGGGGGNKTQSFPGSPADFNRWPFSRYQNGPSTQVAVGS